VLDFEEQTRQAAAAAKWAEQQRASKAASAPAPAPPTPAAAPTSTPAKDKRRQYMAEGVITDAECNQNSAGRVTLAADHSALRFSYSSLAKLSVVEGLSEDSGNAPACADWKGRRARLFFYQTKDRPYTGELLTVQFF